MFSVNDLMSRYNIKNAVSIRRFVSRHLETINADGEEHAKQTPSGWQFDEVAVQIMDRLRGNSSVTIVEMQESEQVRELKEENENLRQLLLVAQSKLIKAQEELNENQKKFLLAESQSKDSQNELKLEQALHEVTKQQVADVKTQLSDTKGELSDAKTQLSNAESQLEQIKKRGLIDRIFNNF